MYRLLLNRHRRCPLIWRNVRLRLGYLMMCPLILRVDTHSLRRHHSLRGKLMLLRCLLLLMLLKVLGKNLFLGHSWFIIKHLLRCHCWLLDLTQWYHLLHGTLCTHGVHGLWLVELRWRKLQSSIHTRLIHGCCWCLLLPRGTWP